MPRRKKERGRPVTRRLPPRIDASPEQIVDAMFAMSPSHRWEYERDGGSEHRCAACNHEVHYPETLYGDGRCKDCRA